MRLELRQVTAGYGETIALRDVSLVVPAGRVVALLGPNGAGKTTLLSAASGLLRPRSGRVLLDGRDVTGASPDRLVRQGLCHITEGRSIFPGLTVADNLKMFAPRTAGSQAIEGAIDAFPRLGERLGQLAGTLSGGEQQLLALARAYAQQAPLVLLDEVSMGLAPIIVDEIFEFLRRLAAEGHSLLIVEQYVAKALALADLVYLLLRGRLVFAGEPAEIAGTDIFAQYLGAEMAEFSSHA
jgi:branched-chain amino acid transport system ATP-binding protein